MSVSLSKVPSELRKILLDFTISCLLDKPTDFVDHGLKYFEKLRDCREKIKLNKMAVSFDDDASNSTETSVIPNFYKGKRQTVMVEQYNPEQDESLNYVSVPKKVGERNLIFERMNDIIIFASVEREERAILVDAMSRRLVFANEIIIQQNDVVANEFFIIEEGIFEASIKDNATAEERVVRTYENKGSFGELALLYNLPRAATIRAVTDGKLWVLDRSTFRKIILKSAHIKRTRYQNLMDKIDFLKPLSDLEKLDLIDCLLPMYFEHNQKVFSQGDPADGMYFIESGAITLIVNHPVMGEKIVTELGSGAFFGELALVTHNNRALTAVASGETKLAFLDKNAFQRLLGPCTDVLKTYFADYKNQMIELVGSSSAVWVDRKDTIHEAGDKTVGPK